MRSAPTLLTAIAVMILGVAAAAPAQDRLDRALVTRTTPLSEREAGLVRGYAETWSRVLLGGDNVSEARIHEAKARLLEPLGPPEPSPLFLTEYRKALASPLDQAFNTERLVVRLDVMIIAARLADPANGRLLLDGLKDPSPAVRYWAARAAAAALPGMTSGNGRAQTIAALREALIAEQVAQVVPQLTQALLAVPGDEAETALLDALGRRVAWQASNPQASPAAVRDVLHTLGRRTATRKAERQTVPPDLVRRLTVVTARHMRVGAAVVASGGLPARLEIEYDDLLNKAHENLDWLVRHMYEQDKGGANPPLSDIPLVHNPSQWNARAAAWRNLLVRELNFRPEELEIDAAPAEARNAAD